MSENRGSLRSGAPEPAGDAALLQATERAVTAELVDRFAQGIAREMDLDRVLSEAIAGTRELCEADGASLLRVDPAKGDLYFDAVCGPSGSAVERRRLAPGQGIAGRVALTATPVLVTEVYQSPYFEPQIDQDTGFKTGSVIAAPLIWGGDVIGVLEAVRSAQREPFGKVHLARLERLAPHVAIALHHAHTTNDLRDAQAQILQANEALQTRVVDRTSQIARAKAEWERTFDAIAEPIALQDGFTVRRANMAYARRAGVPITQVPGRTCYELLGKRTSPCPGCPLLTSPSASADGEVRMGEAIYRFSGFRTEPGTAGSVVVHYQDITQNRALENRLRETERMAAVGQLASGAAHEINNPLGFVISNLEQLRATLRDLHEPAPGAPSEGDPAFAEAMEMIDECLSGSQRVAHIVKSLRDLSRLRIAATGPTSLNASVNRAVQLELRDAPNVELALGPDLWVTLDPLQLEQALVQLLRNARQAVSGDQRIRIHTRTGESGQAEVVVADEGAGIPEHHLPRIFEPFFTTRGIGKGLGLGLTASWGIVSQHGGRIDVASQVGRGSTFTLCLPASEPPGSAPAPSPDRPDEDAGDEGTLLALQPDPYAARPAAGA